MVIVTKIQGLMSDDFRGKCGEPWGFGAAVFGRTRYGEYYERYGVYQKHVTKKGLKLNRHMDNFPSNPRTETQQAWRTLFKNGMTAWKALDTQTKAEYNARVYPKGMPGHSRFLQEYIKANR